MSGTLICGLNWLGDNCMALPAVDAYLRLHQDEKPFVLVKSHMRPFWEMVPGVGEVIILETDAGGLWRTASKLRELGLARAYVLPNSWRSALVPWIARIMIRVGVGRGGRDCLLTTRVDSRSRDAGRHQLWEYMAILGVPEEAIATSDLPLPCRLAIPEAATSRCRNLLPECERWVGLLPGAARGASKQWPVARFASVGRRLQAVDGVRVCVLGSEGERALCSDVVDAIGGGAVNLAGRTSLSELAAVLKACACVVCNDSGGMHLAAAVGTPVVAIYGITDPIKTGPIGRGHRLVMAPDVERSRDVPRDSLLAREALARVSEEDVYSATCMQLGIQHEIAGPVADALHV